MNTATRRPEVDWSARRAARAAFATSAVVLWLGGGLRAQAPVPDPQPAQAQAPTPPDTSQDPTMSGLLSNMRLRGYADLGFGSPLQEKLPAGGLQQGKQSFQIADLHLFLTSKLSEQWTFLSEILFTADFTNEPEAEVDRLIFQYAPNKHFRAGFGKFNTAIGYYSNQFHRAKFYQVATGRPLMFTDEDNGGILPVHQVGITVQGEIPSGWLGLHYIGEVTNGRAFTAKGAQVQDFADDNNFKAVNGGLFARPDAVTGLDAGFSVYRDTLEPAGLGKVRELITAVHAAYITPNLEFLNEGVFLSHRVEASGETSKTKSFYTELSHRIGIVRPYARYEYQNVPFTDSVFGLDLGSVGVSYGVRKAISAGVHFDLGHFGVIKLQYDHALQLGVWANGAHAQLAFAF